MAIDCFGLETSVTSAHAWLHERTGVPIVPAHTEPLPDGRYRLVFHPKIGPTAGMTPQQIAQACWDSFEPYVRKNPAPWLWMCNTGATVRHIPIDPTRFTPTSIGRSKTWWKPTRLARATKRSCRGVAAANACDLGQRCCHFRGRSPLLAIQACDITARRIVEKRCGGDPAFKLLNRDQRNTFVACFLGWALDAFDFFLLTFVIVPMAHDFGTSVADLSYAITITLAMRPVGAFIFGLLGDRFGRRIPLMIDIIFYSLMELLTAFSPNFTVLLIFRALYGIGMGGEWGLGASLAMETLPTQARGLFSEFCNKGYAFGYLLAAVVYWIVFPLFGWRGLFVAGALPAFLVLYIRARVPESPVWLRQQHATGDFGGRPFCAQTPLGAFSLRDFVDDGV